MPGHITRRYGRLESLPHTGTSRIMLFRLFRGEFFDVIPLDGVEDFGLLDKCNLLPLDSQHQPVADRDAYLVSLGAGHGAGVPSISPIFDIVGVFVDGQPWGILRCPPIFDDDTYFSIVAGFAGFIYPRDLADRRPTGVAYGVDLFVFPETVRKDGLKASRRHRPAGIEGGAT